MRLQEAVGHRLNHTEFLELILQDELAVRNDRLVDRRIKAACFRELRALDDFDFSFNPSVKRKQIYDLATCRFTGKSYRLRNRAATEPSRPSHRRRPAASQAETATCQDKGT